MIEMGKQYVTRDGRQVRIYATDAGGDYPVHGAVRYTDSTQWISTSWAAEGNKHPFAEGEYRIDLIELKPRIKRTVWLSMYAGYCTCFLTRPINLASDCLACVKIDIDCGHGEGLKRD